MFVNVNNSWLRYNEQLVMTPVCGENHAIFSPKFPVHGFIPWCAILERRMWRSSQNHHGREYAENTERHGGERGRVQDTGG